LVSENHLNHGRIIGNNLFCVQYTSKIKISQVAKFLPEGHTTHTNLTFTDRLQGPCTDFHDQYVIWRGFAQGCAFWGSRKLYI